MLGRFISADTVVPQPGSSQGWNRYAYVSNNPIRYTDPSGHCIWDACIVEGAIIGASVALAVDYAVQVNHNLNSGMSFGEAVYYENINTQELGGWMLGGTIGGGVTAVAVPAVVPYAYMATDKATQILQNPIGRGSVEGGMQGCSENCTFENVAIGAGQGAILEVIENGNSIKSTKLQHGYEIYEIESENVVRTGISGQPLNKNGKSPRANSQVNAWNKANGVDTYAARVVR